MRVNKKLEKLGVGGVLKAIQNIKGVFVNGRSISFSNTGTGLKTLGKIDYLVAIGGYTSTPVAPERKKKK